MWFLSFILFMWWITLTDLRMLYQPCRVADFQGWPGSLRIPADGRTCVEPSGRLTWLFSRVGRPMHTVSSVSQRQGVPTPLYTKCTQSWQGANVLYNKAWFCALGPTQGYGNTASLNCPDIQVREPDWLHLPLHILELQFTFNIILY